MKICFLGFKTLKDQSPSDMGARSDECFPYSGASAQFWSESGKVDGESWCYKLFLSRQLTFLHLLPPPHHIALSDADLPVAVDSQANVLQFKGAAWASVYSEKGRVIVFLISLG